MTSAGPPQSDSAGLSGTPSRQPEDVQSASTSAGAPQAGTTPASNSADTSQPEQTPPASSAADAPQLGIQPALTSAVAPQPGTTFVAAQQLPWAESLFLTEVLPATSQALQQHGPQFRVSSTLRQTLNMSYQLYEWLPLLTSSIANFDVADALQEPGAVVVAEVIARVPDANRPGFQRVDFFCYKENGDVVRYHPGHSEKGDMKPHRMPHGSLCFHRADAALHGVGQTLHAQPPKMVLAAQDGTGATQPGISDTQAGAADPGATQPGNTSLRILATHQDMEQLCEYDVNMVNWGRVKAALNQVPDHNHTEDWSDGRHFPWWVWLANKGHLRDVVNDGVAAVEVEVTNREKCVLVHSVGGVYRLSGNKVIKPLVIRSLRRGI